MTEDEQAVWDDPLRAAAAADRRGRDDPGPCRRWDRSTPASRSSRRRTRRRRPADHGLEPGHLQRDRPRRAATLPGLPAAWPGLTPSGRCPGCRRPPSRPRCWIGFRRAPRRRRGACRPGRWCGRRRPDRRSRRRRRCRSPSRRSSTTCGRSVGPYREVFAGALVRRLGLPTVHVPFIAVDSPPSLRAGRCTGACPRRSPASPGTAGNRVRSEGDGWSVAVAMRSCGPRLPAAAPVLPVQGARRTLGDRVRARPGRAGGCGRGRADAGRLAGLRAARRLRRDGTWSCAARAPL